MRIEPPLLTFVSSENCIITLSLGELFERVLKGSRTCFGLNEGGIVMSDSCGLTANLRLSSLPSLFLAADVDHPAVVDNRDFNV
jgi:hypothetical protein